jgi:cytochrome c-type biogenesis protein CcmF
VILGSTALIVSRLDDLRSEAKLDSLMSREAFFLVNNLVLVGLCVVIFWGTFFPLISEALSGDEASVGPPWFNRVTTPLALVLVALAAIGPMVPWRRASRAGLVRSFRLPLAVMATTLVALLAFTSSADSPLALIMFCFVALVLTVVVQELARGTAARRTITGDAWPRAMGQLIARNRRRYGGYLVHAGIAILFLGVAASSAFQDQQDVRLSPGESFKAGGYDITYVRPTAEVGRDTAGTGAPITFGAVLRARRGDEVKTLHPSRNYYPSQNAEAGPIGRFFEGEATSEVDVRWGLRRDLWTAVRPDIAELEPAIREANAKFAGAGDEVQAIVIAAIVDRYRKNAPPASFRAIDSPLVSWIWIGGAIMILGALIAIWPSPEARMRRVTSIYAAKLGKELSSA